MALSQKNYRSTKCHSTATLITVTILKFTVSYSHSTITVTLIVLMSHYQTQLKEDKEIEAPFTEVMFTEVTFLVF